MRKVASYILELAGVASLVVAAWRGVSPEVGMAIAGGWLIAIGWWIDR